MSHIDQAIRILKIMSSEVKPSKVPAFLEQVHKTLISLSDKEASLSSTAKAAAPKSMKTKKIKKNPLPASTVKTAISKVEKATKKPALASTAKAAAPKIEKETKKPAPKIEKETKKPSAASTAKAAAPKIEKETKKPAPKIEKETKKPAPKIEKETKKPSAASTAKTTAPKTDQDSKKVDSAPKAKKDTSTSKKPKPFMSIKKSVTDDAVFWWRFG
jgi:hypothetical protein